VKRLQLFWRAFGIVFLTAMNVVNIGNSQWILMTATGFGISWLWWANAQQAVDHRDKKSQLAYACGAAAGTLIGAATAKAIGRLL